MRDLSAERVSALRVSQLREQTVLVAGRDVVEDPLACANREGRAAVFPATHHLTKRPVGIGDERVLVRRERPRRLVGMGSFPGIAVADAYAV